MKVMRRGQEEEEMDGLSALLLGRENAIVEFDGCIERLESAKGMPLKKREKYACREDVILHALELERQMLKKQYKL
ncbi:PWWP domain-containing protein, partial [Trifolium pratense]